ncbi:MAG: M14 family zinc carboxypeptidase [Candidatus Cloacimonadaceae bacterium]
MRNLLIIAFLVAMAALWAQGETLPDCYHTYAQISQMLSDLEAQHPDIAKRVQIGLTQQDQLPIYAMRISDNPGLDEEEPALLFVGQVHAEEVLGVQITLNNISEILANRDQFPYLQWINFLDMWFVPTLNPEGHNVVTANLDTSYRKNKRDNDLNGIFDYSPLVGYDADGVDINRNFDFNWCHGDSLLQPGGLEVWDYYRGPGPMSESEVHAIKALADQYKFVYSICWHSSRTGNFSEKCYHSFNWKEVRPSPDLAFAASISNSVAAQIINEAGTAAYESLPNLSRKGCFHDWMYKQYGSYQLLIECGTSNLQPPEALMQNTIQRCRNGVYWLLNRALPNSQAVPSSSMLTGNIRDAVSNEPLEAEIIIEGHHAPWFVPRTSDPETGRFFKPLATGTYTVRARKRGYWDTVIPNQMVYNNNWTQIQIALQPRQPASLSGLVRSGGSSLAAQIVIGDVYPDTLAVNGHFVYNGFEGEYPVTVYADGYYPWLGTVQLNPGVNSIMLDLSPATLLLAEDWESGTDGWTIEGPWVLQNELAASGHAITDSWGGNGFYAMNCDVWIAPADPLVIPAGTSSMLTFDSHLYSEWTFDPATVEASPDSLQWTVLWTKSGQHDHFSKELVPLDDLAGQTVFLRFRLTDQSTHVELTDPGWTIDNIRVITGSSTGVEDPDLPGLSQAALYQNFPNPFNPQTNIRYSLAAWAEVKLAVYNLKGQLVKELVNKAVPAGNHRAVWDGSDSAGNPVGSGIYLYRLESGNYSKTLKMILAK